ncbi:MAG: hypothetical protein U0934_04025 [Pseudotabrizicola sp.]|nr:hypothetical protein [Pseudotabrizicola sp.]MDZ7573110.1 hypothetical protein [Pseudotabrizicola sp.]
MDDTLRLPVATPSDWVVQFALHQSLVCRSCKHDGLICEHGFDLLRRCWW